MSETAELKRSGHASFDVTSREKKGLKIALLIDALALEPSSQMLEIGTGSGGVARYFGSKRGPGWQVTSVDVEDARVTKENYEFLLVDGPKLPFEDEAFDVVVSNHVVEHVGDKRSQQCHLSEMARVLRRGGRGYLAVPNRWMVLEPHFRLPFLSWLPQSLADRYVRVMRRGRHYDCRPLTVKLIEPMFEVARLKAVQRVSDAVKVTCAVEYGSNWPCRFVLSRLPRRTDRLIRHIFPTLIYTFERGGSANEAWRYGRPRNCL